MADYNWSYDPQKAAAFKPQVQQWTKGQTTPGKFQYRYGRKPTTGEWSIGRRWIGDYTPTTSWPNRSAEDTEKSLSLSAKRSDERVVPSTKYGVPYSRLGGSPLTQVSRTTTMPASWNPSASQFPWQSRQHISSDAARQWAYKMGIGTGGAGVPYMARKARGTYFDPRTAFAKKPTQVGFSQFGTPQAAKQFAQKQSIFSVY